MSSKFYCEFINLYMVFRNTVFNLERDSFKVDFLLLISSIIFTVITEHNFNIPILSKSLRVVFRQTKRLPSFLNFIMNKIFCIKLNYDIFNLLFALTWYNNFPLFIHFAFRYFRNFSMISF